MSNLEPPWDSYFSVQQELKNSSVADEASWGREAQLNRIVAAGTLSDADEFERVARSERRLERYRAGLRRRHLVSEGHVDGEAVVHARLQLLMIKDVAGDAWPLLMNLGQGFGYGELATATGVSEGALRVRAQRARRKSLAPAA